MQKYFSIARNVVILLVIIVVAVVLYFMLTGTGGESTDGTNAVTENPFLLLSQVFVKMKSQLMISLKLLGWMLLVLSLLFYWTEHRAQPEVYKNYATSVLWVFVKCIRDPGEMAPPRPISLLGKIVANTIGIICIAIFVIPAGLISSGFVAVMNEEAYKKLVAENVERIKKSFRWTKNSSVYSVPTFVPIDNIMTKQFITEKDIYDAVKASPELHLYNLAKAYNQEDAPSDRVVVVACPHNRPYGYCIDRKSNVTIVSTSGYDEPITSWVAYHIALIGNFNYVAKEIEMDVDAPVSYFRFENAEEEADENFRLFVDDINRLSSGTNSWVVPMAFTIGPQSRVEKIHLCYSPEKEDEGYSNPSIVLKDTVRFEKLFSDMNDTMSSTFEMPCDKNKYYAVPKYSLCNKIKCQNNFFLRMECPVIYFSSKRLSIIKSIADVISRNVGNGKDVEYPQVMQEYKCSRFAYDGYIVESTNY